MFIKKKYRFSDWLNVIKVVDANLCSDYKIDYLVRKTDLVTMVNPHELAGDFYRLLCVLCILFGYLYANTTPDYVGFSDLYTLMKGSPKEINMPGLSDRHLLVFNKLEQLNSTGELINWEKVLGADLFKELNLTKLYINAENM